MNKLLWAIFGNDEDGPTGDKLLKVGETGLWPTDPYWLRCVKWWARNPFHNLCFHVIGFVQENPGWIGRWDGVFASDDPKSAGASWNWGYCLRGTRQYPFVSYDGRMGRGYIGWRKGGAFAIRPPVRGTIILAVLGAIWGVLHV